MRRLFAALALPLLLFSLTAAHEAPDREAEDLLGPVRSVSSWRTILSPGEEEKDGLTMQEDLVVYDEPGNEIERTVYDDYGFLVGRQVRKRNGDGHLIESILSDPDGAVMERQVYVRSGGKLAETVHYDGKGVVGLKEVNRYDEGGRLTEVTYHQGKKAAAKTVYRYDGAGRGSEAAYFLADGSPAVAPVGPCLGAHRMTYAYDEQGRPRTVVAYQPDGTMKKSWVYAYNDKGQMAEEKREGDQSSATYTYAYEYDERGNWIKRIATVDEQHRFVDFDLLGGPESESGETAPTQRRMTNGRIIAYH